MKASSRHGGGIERGPGANEERHVEQLCPKIRPFPQYPKEGNKRREGYRSIVGAPPQGAPLRLLPSLEFRNKV